MVVIVNKLLDTGEEGGAKCAAFFLLSWGKPPASKLVSLESTNTSTDYQLSTEGLSSPNPFAE